MKKNLYHVLSTAVFCFLMSSALFAPVSHEKQEADQSVAASEGASVVSLIKDAFVERAQVALEGLSALFIQGISTDSDGKKVNLRDIGALLLQMKKYELAGLSQLESIAIDNGILILSPGAENSVSYLATPEQKKRVTCKTMPRGGVHLGFSGGVKGERLVVFSATYTAGKLPRIVASGNAQVFVRPVDGDGLFEVQLSDAARCVAQEVRAGELRIRVVGDSSFSAASVTAGTLLTDSGNKSQVNLVGCRVSELVKVTVNGSSSVSLQGSTIRLEAHVLGSGELDSALLKADEVTLFPAKTAKKIMVHAARKLDAYPSKRGIRGVGSNEALVIENIGNPVIENSSGVAVRNVKDASSLLSRLGSGEGIARNGTNFIHDVRQVVSDAMKVATTFLDILAR